MGGGGSIQGMNNSLNNNRKLLQKPTYFNRKRSLLELRREYQSTINGISDYNMASEDDLKQIRAKIIKQRRKESAITLSIFLLLLPFVIYFSIGYFKTSEIHVTKKEKIELEQKSDKFNFYLADGDNYLKNSQWHNAIFQYKKALDIYPNSYHAQYRLVFAYTYRCRNTQLNCTQASEQINTLLTSYPEKQELIELEQVLVFAETNASL